MSGTLTLARGITGVSDTSGTVTSITAGTGLTGTPNPIIGAGTIALTVPVAANLGGTGVANGAGSTITLGGAFSVAGAFALALTLTAGTALTLPTSGTLATTANLASYLPLAGGTMLGALGGVIGTVGAPSLFAAGATTTGVNFLTGGATIQQVISGVAVTTATAALYTIAGTLNVNTGTITTSQPMALTSTWNASGVTFKALTVSVTDPAANAGSASGSLLLDLLCGTAGTTSVFSVGKTGITTIAGTLDVASSLVLTTGFATVMWNGAQLGWGSTSTVSRLTVADTILTRAAAANVQFGAANVSTGAVAQIISFQGNTGATTTGPLATIVGAAGGSGAGSIGGELRLSGGLTAAAGTGGTVTIYTAPSGAGGTPALAMTWTAAGGSVIASGKTLTLGNAATTGLGAGVVAALTNATVVILDSTGQAYRVPCII